MRTPHHRSPPWRWGLLLVGLATLLALAGCRREARPEFPYEGEFRLYGPEGLTEETVTVVELLEEGRPLVLNIWAGACPPCRQEMPDFQDVYEEYEGRVTLFGAEVGALTNLGTPEDAVELLEEHGITYPTGSSDDFELLLTLRVTGVPATYFVAPDGEILHRWTGMVTRDTLSRWVEDLLAATE